ncbi:hypothetical protein BVU17_16920 [Haloarcula taiwanensis]|uniref:DUF1616 domain-containing protein n=1 Tax=Haloarcula taiwanensis TaxID=1932004 RepID=A0A2H5A3H9_9EURY|nr:MULTISPECIES: DUF1616 domain-containing protein [Haloarcula]AUG49255.1 hypothetical protein BVU17_16920 [Haloarcula taiwanensis]RLM34617.1 DUF1616 domain-containing protein [Haloarcula sp. Atlit-120R]
MATDADANIETEAFPIDLLLIGLLGLWHLATVQGYIGQSPARVVLGLVAVLIAPGYALTALLFPRGSAESDGSFDNWGGRISTGERCVLAVGTSVCIVPLLGLGVVLISPGETTGPYQLSIGVTTVVLTIAAAIRRLRVPADESFSPLRWMTTVRSKASRPPVRSVPMLRTLLVLGLLLSGTGIGYAAISTDRGEQFTEFALVTESDNGEPIASEYPSEMALGSSRTVQVTIGNHEGQELNYTVVVIAQRIKNGSVLATAQIGRFRSRVAAGETLNRSHEMSPTLVGEDIRVSYLLYRNEAPVGSNPRPENAYRRTHIWVSVTST